MSACTGVVDFDIYEREVYLPAGRWKDTRDGKEYEGGCTVLADAPVDSMPVFEKL